MLDANARGVIYLLCAAIVMGANARPSTAGDQPHAAAAASARAATAKANAIDWRLIEHGAPVPHQLPVVADADTGMAAGFAPQWIQRSITDWPPSVQDPNLPAKIVQRIANGERRRNDPWAHEVANRLQDGLRKNGNADVLRYARVFCGSVGCLCYFETPLDSSSLDAYDHARSGLLHAMLDQNGWGMSFGITAANVGEVGETGVWELIYILKGKPVFE
jgi:hypothetical protein